MRKITVLLLIIFLLAGCSSKNTYKEPDLDVVIYPDSTQKKTVNGYVRNYNSNASNSSESDNDEIIYYVNTKSKKIHLPECVYAKKSSEINISIEIDYEALISNWYSPCGVCKP